ncbi:MAG: rod shape-determining protein MreC [Ferruginibacter sp.]
MRNIFLFIRRFFNFITLLLLQGFCIYLIVHYNTWHNAVASGFMNEVTGKINTQYNKIDYYFQLKKTNEQLAKDNERLRNLLKENFDKPDTATRIVTDSIPYDTLGNHRTWLYLSAKVVSNSVTAQNNFIVLGRGSVRQIKKDQGVVDPNNGVVGIVTDISDNFAVVMSLLHKDSKISVKLKNGGDAGQVIWDGIDPNRLTLTDIRKSAKVAKGDTVYTSGFTPTFPPGLMVGTIDEIAQEKSTNNYNIKLKSATNFYNLQYVYAIENFQKDEINRLLKNANNKINN